MTSWKNTLLLAEKSLGRADPTLASLIERFGPFTVTRHTDYYRQLVRSIVGQQLSVKAAATIYGRFIELFNNVMPTPEQIISIDSEELRKVGFSYSKASYVKDLASRIIDGRLDLDNVATLPNQLVIEQLVSVKGIGEWSAHMFMMFSLGRLDVLPTGDLGIRKAMMILYDLSELPEPPLMHEIALKNGWAPYQSIASWYLWQSLDNEPK